MLPQLLAISKDPATVFFSLLFSLGALAFVVSFHEFAHALVAFKLGDPTARLLGRLTLNPLSHLDPLGTLALIFFGFGWGRPVPFNPENLSNPRRDTAFVALAGPLSNVLIALVLAGLYKFFPSSFLFLLIKLNLALALFNLIPLHPLDGFKVVLGFLPSNLAFQWNEIRLLGPYILLFLILTDVFALLLFKPLNFLLRILVG